MLKPFLRSGYSLTFVSVIAMILLNAFFFDSFPDGKLCIFVKIVTIWAEMLVHNYNHVLIIHIRIYMYEFSFKNFILILNFFKRKRNIDDTRWSLIWRHQNLFYLKFPNQICVFILNWWFLISFRCHFFVYWHINLRGLFTAKATFVRKQ